MQRGRWYDLIKSIGGVMNKLHKIGILCILAGLLNGCSNSIITTAYVNQPVMLGKIKRIQVNEQESEQTQQKVPFDIRIVRQGMFFNQDFPYQFQADVELLKRINSPQDEVIVDEIRISSDSFCLFILFGQMIMVFNSSEAGIIGAIYGSKKDDHEKK
jgi:hypothetical protein